jgi:hypothetical protein
MFDKFNNSLIPQYDLPVVLHGNWVVRVIDEADTYTVVGRDVEGLYTVALSKSTDAPLLDASILQVL